jgi:hypothetical protein
VAYEEYAGIEVSGQSVAGTLHGFRTFKSLASRYLLDQGLGMAGKDGLVEIDSRKWYALDRWLSVFNRVASEVGDTAVLHIGKGVMENIQWPPGTTTVEGLLHIIDAGYHMHHRKGGKLMFDATSGVVVPGIGSFALKREDSTSYYVETANPYPCAFDRGILAGGLRRLHANVIVTHDDASPCRLKGARSCTHIVAKA